MDKPGFEIAPDERHPGWFHWRPVDPTRFAGFMGDLGVTVAGEGLARFRMQPDHRHTNVIGTVHGGALLTFVDMALFASATVLRQIDSTRSVTLDLSAQFIGAAQAGAPLDAAVELLRETGRMLFMRGLVTQGEQTVLSFSATVRKPSERA